MPSTLVVSVSLSLLVHQTQQTHIRLNKMLSFRSIALFVALACTTFSSAAPATNNLPGVLLADAVGVPALPVGASALPVGVSALSVGVSALSVDVSALPVDVSALPVALPALPALPVDVPALPVGASALPAGAPALPALPALPVALPARRRGEPSKSTCDYFSDATDSIKPIAVELKALVSVDGADKVDKTAVLGHLNEIVVILKVVLTGLQGCKDSGLSLAALLSFKGVVVTVHELALIVYGLLQILIEVLCVVVRIVGVLEFALWPVIVIIGGLLFQILTLVCVLVDGLKVVLVVVVEPLVADLAYLQFTQVLACLGI
ncbi:hypothetical protein BYT27DRAFT_7252867 [Phlegmacium glaucopus]|nr:hypothetical protein BYT27DRAFT_7252867 [Phlegmacium glaucopus]